jgi:hypothetical protein
MKGFKIGDVRWVDDHFGYQSVRLPSTAGLRNSHVKVWVRPGGAGTAYSPTRKRTVPEAKAYIKQLQQKGPLFALELHNH